jgi:hypothetical protein
MKLSKNVKIDRSTKVLAAMLAPLDRHLEKALIRSIGAAQSSAVKPKASKEDQASDKKSDKQPSKKGK